MEKDHKDQKTIASMTILIFLYFFIIQQYPFEFALAGAFAYLSVSCCMKGTTMLIDLIQGRTKNDSNKSD